MTLPVHRLDESARPLLVRHFQALGDEDTQLRFGSLIHADARAAYVAQIDFSRDAVFGAYDEALELFAVAHLACVGGEAELGLSVLPAGRGQGFGTALFDRGVMHARNLQVRRLLMTCLARNTAMMHIARKAGMEITVDTGGVDAWLTLAPGNPLTLSRELAEQELARFDWHLKAGIDGMRRAFQLT